MVPVGSVLVKRSYSNASGMAYRVYSKRFPDMVCLCKCSKHIQWILDEYLTDDLVFIHQKDNPEAFTVAYTCDLSELTNDGKQTKLRRPDIQ